MKRLSQLINITVNNKLWCPIKIARNGPLLSHLCFANDIILFAKANNDQVKVIKGVLDLFCNCSGKKKIKINPASFSREMSLTSFEWNLVPCSVLDLLII